MRRRKPPLAQAQDREFGAMTGEFESTRGPLGGIDARRHGVRRSSIWAVAGRAVAGLGIVSLLQGCSALAYFSDTWTSGTGTSADTAWLTGEGTTTTDVATSVTGGVTTTGTTTGTTSTGTTGTTGTTTTTPVTVVATSSYVSGSTATGATGSAADYDTLTSSNNRSNALGGITFDYSDPANPSTLAVERVTGTYNPGTDALTMNVGTLPFQDADGPNSSGTYSETIIPAFAPQPAIASTVTVASETTLAGVSRYDYVDMVTSYEIFDIPDLVDPTAWDYGAGTGIVGIGTDSADMPTGGTATYTGESRMKYVNSSGTKQLDTGPSAVVADFGAGTAQISMATSSSANMPIDQVDIKDAAIYGSRISGGTVSASMNGSPVDFVGSAGASGGASFYGYDDTAGAPDEVAGILVMPTTTNGSFTAYYFAD